MKTRTLSQTEIVTAVLFGIYLYEMARAIPGTDNGDRMLKAIGLTLLDLPPNQLIAARLVLEDLRVLAEGTS